MSRRGGHFDPFARDWVAAMNVKDPYGAALATSPDTSGEGKVSALEAFHFADAVHDSYDTPVYCERGDDADSQHLNQRWRYLWPLRQLILRELDLIRREKAMPEPAFREVVERAVGPALSRLDDDLSNAPPAQLEARVRNLLRDTIR